MKNKVKDSWKFLLLISIVVFQYSCLTNGGRVKSVLDKYSEVVEELRKVPFVERRDNKYNFDYTIINDLFLFIYSKKGKEYQWYY